ncbi:MAG TPA: DMT family transporter, partial [Saprospiraceae bacterium]|nr:DMT family transporter [Saprospiraceae bacterium]
MKQTLLAHLALFFVALIYAANFSIAKYVMTGGYLGPSGFILCRVLSALILFVLYHRIFIRQEVEAKDKRALFWCAVFGVASNQLLFFIGLNHTSPIHAALIMTTTPITVVIVESLLRKSKVGFRKISGISIAFTGAIMIIISGKDIGFSDKQIFGDLLVFGNAVSYSIYLVKIKPFILKYHPITINRITFVYGALLVLPFGFQEAITAKWADFTPGIWWAFVYVLFFTTF